jgi:hypothetical protein
MTYLGVPSIATMFPIVFIFLSSFYTPLHISALMGHLQVKYTQSLMEAIMPTTDRFFSYPNKRITESTFCPCDHTYVLYCNFEAAC